MKKQVLITAIILSSIISPVFAADGADISMPVKDLNIQERFYESPLSQIPNVDVTDNRNPDYIPISRVPAYGKNMPLFKQCRIRITNYFRQKSIDEAKKILDDEKKQQEGLNGEALKEDKNSVTLSTFGTDLFEKNINDVTKQNSSVTVDNDVKTINMELVGGIKEQVTTKDVILDAETVDFNNKTMDVTATGKPVLIFPQQKITLKADKIVYNNVSNILRAYDNVEIIKEDSTVYGDFIQINMNEENSFMTNVKSVRANVEIHSKNATSDDKTIVMNDGQISSTENYVFKMQTAMIGGFDYSRMLISDDDRSSLSDYTSERKLNIKVKDITLNAKKAHNVVTAKEIEVYNGKKHLFDFRSFEAHTNKGQNYFEGNYPELGSRNPMGMFVGPGYVLDIPNGSTLKLVPLLNYKNKIGFGGALKYKSATNTTDLMYGSSNDVWVLKGKQFLDDKLYLQYGMNAFLDEWFIGARMSKYSAELVYEDGAIIKDSIGKDLNMQFKNRVSAGYMADSEYVLGGENLKQGSSTARLRYMAEINQSIFKREDKENLKSINLSMVLQGSAAVYGTGDTQFIGRVGPMLHTQYKYWMQDIGYFASAYQDGTPLKRYDTYRYGHSNVYIREAIRLNKFLAIGWAGSVNLMKDAPNGKMFQENGFIFSLGPDDLKVNLGYDFVREATYFNITMAMDTKDTTVDFKKMVIKNPDRLTSSEPELKEIPKQTDFTSSEKDETVKPVMQYAEVIEIQDPDREQVQ